MNTPAHIAASLLVWNRETGWRETTAVTVGAILPDATMFLFYGFEKSIGASERLIWSELYFLDHWQYTFDLFNSIPIALTIFAVSLWLRCRWAQLLALSATLHMLCDLPLHHDDGHRHFLPLSHIRFASPISYWDPKHFGWIVAPLEFVFSIGALIYVTRKGATPARWIAKGTLVVYGLAITAVVIFLAVVR